MPNKKILLIGGYGFLGCNILKWADDNLVDIDFTVLSSIRTITNHEKFSCVKEEFFGDFGDDLFLKNVFLNNEYDYVFHCLTATTPVNSNTAIVRDIECNLINTIRLLEIIKNTNAILVFFSSGGAIYGNSEAIKHKVDDTPRPISSYGIVKNTIEHYIRMFNNLYGLRYLILRISNPYGYFHKSKTQGLINVAIAKCLKNEPIEIWGDGENVKDYIFSQDIPPIIFSLLREKIINTTLNIGSGEGTSINLILSLIKKIHPTLQVVYRESKSHDVKDFILDINPLKDFKPATPLVTGIVNTYEWYSNKNS
ncbi:MAG TPA: NAD-dependent epimerase/dehydratase family protein [Pelobium sp.]|nr:NAD-dependent epimerase/dehydratase family protein [Pelobium sp.]